MSRRIARDTLSGALAAATLTLLIEDSIDSAYLNLPMAIGMNDIVMMYIERMVRFFKAYTTDLRNFSTFLLVDRPATESIRLMNLLAGIRTTWGDSDRMDTLEDVYGAISRWVAEDAKPGGLLLDLAKTISKAREHDIARILDALPSWYLYALEVSPAAKMRDRVTIKTSFGRREALMMATRGQRQGDVFVMQLTDPSGMDNTILMTLEDVPVIPTNLDEAELSEETATESRALRGAIKAPVDRGSANMTRARGVHGLGDGAMIIPN